MKDNLGLVGRRPTHIDEIRLARQPRTVPTGECFECGGSLKTPTDAFLHVCDKVLTMKHRRMGERRARVSL